MHYKLMDIVLNKMIGMKSPEVVFYHIYHILLILNVDRI